ncbi:hypothetical protein ANCDUO_05767, partial [Ancylostoma duodenale]
MKYLVWTCGLVNPENADIRAHALCKMEDNLQTTLKELSAEIQQIISIRQVVKLLGNQSSSTVPDRNSLNAKKNHLRYPPSLFFQCGGPQWAKDCDFIKKMFQDCKGFGHKKGSCKNFEKKTKPIPKQKRRSANNFPVIAASSTIHVAQSIAPTDKSRFQP